MVCAPLVESSITASCGSRRPTIFAKSPRQIPLAPPWLSGHLGLLDLHHAHLVRLVARLGYRGGILLLLSQSPLVVLIHCLHAGVLLMLWQVSFRYRHKSGQSLPDLLWWRSDLLKTMHDHSAQ